MLNITLSYGDCFQNRAMFSTYVVASGLQYGMGEEVLHYFFKVGFERLLLLQHFLNKHATLVLTQSKRFKLKIHFFLNPFSEVNQLQIPPVS